MSSPWPSALATPCSSPSCSAWTASTGPQDPSHMFHLAPSSLPVGELCMKVTRFSRGRWEWGGEHNLPPGGPSLLPGGQAAAQATAIHLPRTVETSQVPLRPSVTSLPSSLRLEDFCNKREDADIRQAACGSRRSLPYTVLRSGGDPFPCQFQFPSCPPGPVS